MPYKPLISKLRCHNPNKKSAKYANKVSVIYIATREGTDLSDELDEEMYQYSSDRTYLNYIAKRPGADLVDMNTSHHAAHGLFGNFDCRDLKAVEKMIGEKTSAGVNIYREIISLSGEDAAALGFKNKKSWYNYLRAAMPDIATTLGIPLSSLKWCAAFHTVDSHPHCHVMFWDDSNKVRSNYIHVSKQIEIRNKLSDRMFSPEYEAMLKDLQKDEYQELYSIKNQNRDQILHSVKELFEGPVEFVPGTLMESLPARMSHDEFEQLQAELKALSAHLPSSGRLSYKYLPPETKKELDEISKKILERPDMQKKVSAILSAVEDIGKLGGKTQTEISRNLRRTSFDIQKRTGNIILGQLKKDGLLNTHPDTKHPSSPEKKLSQSHNSTDSSIWEHYKNAKSDLEEIRELRIEMKLAEYEGDIELDEQRILSKYENAYQELKLVYFEAEGLPSDLAEYSLGSKIFLNPDSPLYDLEEAIEMLESSASKDNEYAQYQLGRIYANPKYEFYDLDKAVSFFQKSSDKDNSYAQYNLGKIYIDEESGYYDMEKGIEHLRRSADQDNGYAQYRLSVIHLDTSSSYYEIDKGISYLRDAVKNDNVNAKYKIAKLYFDQNISAESNIIKKTLSTDQAFGYLEDAYKSGHDLSRYLLGKIYGDPSSPKYNIEKAIQYFQECAQQTEPNSYALFHLGKIYATEDLPVYDFQKALSYLQKSADLNNNSALYQLGKIYMDPESEHFDLDKAIEYFQKSADAGNDFALYRLGKIYMNPESARFDLDKAIRYLQQASDAGNSSAQYQLGRIHMDPESEYFYLDKAIECFQKSADAGNDFALYQLGKIYVNPANECYNLESGLKFLFAAAESNNAYAYRQLGAMYIWGRNGLKKDVALGKSYLNKAIELGNEYEQHDLDNYQHVILSQCTYSIVKILAASLETYKQQNAAALNDAVMRSHSKAAQKELAIKHGKHPDQEQLPE